MNTRTCVISLPLSIFTLTLACTEFEPEDEFLEPEASAAWLDTTSLALDDERRLADTDDADRENRADYIRLLAQDYLFKNVADEESKEILERIRSLSESDADRFHEIVTELAGLQGLELDLFDAAHEFARDNDISFIDVVVEDDIFVVSGATGLDMQSIQSAGEASLSQHLGVTAGQDPEPLCIWPYVSCASTNSWNKTLVGMSCLAGACTTGTWSDRTSNSSCELSACDYRMRFTRTGTGNIDGKTAAADCVILHYSGLIAYTSGSYTYALSGVGGPSACGLSTTNMHQYFQVR